jgi:hypothetical protein
MQHEEKDAKVKRVGSFYLSGIYDFSDVMNLDYVNDSTFYSFNFNANTLEKFSKRDDHNYKFVYEKQIQIEDVLQTFCVLNSNLFLLVDFET